MCKSKNIHILKYNYSSEIIYQAPTTEQNRIYEKRKKNAKNSFLKTVKKTRNGC